MGPQSVAVLPPVPFNGHEWNVPVENIAIEAQHKITSSLNSKIYSEHSENLSRGAACLPARVVPLDDDVGDDQYATPSSSESVHRRRLHPFHLSN